MSTIESNDLATMGYFLPEDSQLRLKQLREYVEFLANLARPRRPDEGMECFAEIRPGEVAICMELLEEQVAQVLGELSWPAKRGETVAAGEADAESKACTQAAKSDVTEPLMDEAGNRLLVGVSLDQIDEINLLLSSLRALGNVVTCSDHAELSDVTLSIMGDAIVRDVEKLRDIMRDVQGQTLKPLRTTEPGVREEWAAYGVLPVCLPMGSVPPIVRQLPTYQ
jgi:hypothetical protein